MDPETTINVTDLGLNLLGRHQLICACGAGFTCTTKDLEAHKWDAGCPKCQRLPIKRNMDYRPLYMDPHRAWDDFKGIRIGKLIIQKLVRKDKALLVWRVTCTACNSEKEVNSREVYSRRRGMGVLTDCGCKKAQEAAQRALRAEERAGARAAALISKPLSRTPRNANTDLSGLVFGNFEVVRQATNKHEVRKGTGTGRMWVIQCRNCQAVYVRSTSVIRRLNSTCCARCRSYWRSRKPSPTAE